MLEPQTLRFLNGLKKNNDRAWFEAHRAQYEAARIDFQNFIQLVIDDLERKDPAITGVIARDCLFRINRDVRFSKDKSPYKSNMGASIKQGGKKSPFAGYYFHCEPGSSFVGGGLWMPDAPTLKKIRQEVDYCWDEFSGIIKERKFRLQFKDLHRGEGISLATNPKGYDKGNPAIDYLKLKSFIAEAGIKDEELTQASLHKKTVAAFEALQPLLKFLNRVLAPDV